ncbi:hypothetical protein OUZ56_018263 [Daphnia magna]|uniref:MULE transposase domain-containing protein n=1 Tax=Daphnia magna TaxID=35525 RepID=A0ABQ9Z8F4_9CRUS|nr:hypothetical protein OUZ56_018263 [Daphnia magna]
MTMRDGVFTQTGAHNHDAQFGEQHRAAAVNECLNLARAPRMGRQAPKRILEVARYVHCEARIALHPALERRIQRQKRSNQPLQTVSIDDMMESMEFHPVFKETILGDLFFNGTVRSDEDDDVPGVGLIFVSLLLLGQLGEATSMHLDGTFHTAFPVAFVLMTRKTHDLYTSVLRLIIRIYEDRFPEKPIAIYDMVTDFKLALMGAVSDVMDVESRGCWFHYGKAIIRKWFNKRCVYSHLNVWDFLEDEESKSRDFLTAENGDPIGRGSTPAQRKRKIARNSSLLEDGYLTIREFLEWTRKTFNVPLPADDEAAEDELNEEEAPEDIQGDVSNEDIPDIPYGHGRQRFRAGVRLTARQRRAIERRDRAAARHNRREILENLPARNETPPPGSPTPGSPLARPVTPPTRPDTPLFPPRPVTPLVSPFRPEALEIPPPVTPEIPPIRPLTPETHFRSMASPSGLMFADTSPRQHYVLIGLDNMTNPVVSYAKKLRAIKGEL